MLQKKLTAAWIWYKNLPWWGKILGSALLIGIGVLALLALIVKIGFFIGTPAHIPRKESNAQHEAMVDSVLEGNEEQQKILDGVIRSKKREIATKLNQARAIDRSTLEARERIMKAKDLDELLELQKELEL